MKIELTNLQLERIISLVDEKYKSDTKNNAFYLGLKNNLNEQKEKSIKKPLSKIPIIEVNALTDSHNYPKFF